jgi:hypothetical protein
MIYDKLVLLNCLIAQSGGSYKNYKEFSTYLTINLYNRRTYDKNSLTELQSSEKYYS